MDKWVAEFFLRRQQNPRVYATPLFSALKLVDSDDCVKFKITAVLRDISNSLLRGTVDEGMLDLLEMLEKLLLQEQSVIMGSLKSAYCWTAAECTLRFMWPVTPSDGFFSEAIERIWKKRIGILKERESDLVTHELLNWESDLKKAFEEPEMYKKIRETNIRYNAISHLNQLLKEQWALLGCSSLESEARKRILKLKDQNAFSKRCRPDYTVGNVTGELRIYGRSQDREETNDVEGGGGAEDPNGIDMANEQEKEHEPRLNNGDTTVAQELKDFLLEIQGLLEASTRQEQAPNNAKDQVVDVNPQPNVPNMIEEEVSQGTSSSGRIRRLNVSPLKKGRAAKPRRPMKFWLPEEMKALKEGVKEFGKSWKDIKNSNPVVLASRTEVDLKDKWRNLHGR